MLDQHPPPLAGHAEPADDGIDRDEHIVSLNGPVLERNVQRKVPPADGEPGRVPGNQCTGDAEIRFVPHEPVGIE